MAVLIEFLTMFCHLSIMAAASRMIWAFARGTSLPGSGYLKRIRLRMLSIFDVLGYCSF